MERSRGNGGVVTGIILSAIGALIIALPPMISADMMAWGFAVMTLGFFVLTAGVTTLLLYLRRRKVLKRMDDSREVLARWTYDAATWRDIQKEELDSNKGMPVFGAVIGGIFLVIGLVFFLSDPDEMGIMLAIMAGVGLLIAFVAWLATRLKNRAILKDPGEVIIAHGGVYYQGQLTDWNNVTSWFDLAKLEKKDGHTDLVMTYRYLAGRRGQIHSSQVSLPVPPGKEQEAQFAADRLNVQPY
jgi:hypothetical protein